MNVLSDLFQDSSKLNHFLELLNTNDEKEEGKKLYSEDPAFFIGEAGFTSLMNSLNNRSHSFTRWLLSVPEVDTNISDEGLGALHVASDISAPMDILVKISKLSTWETINRTNSSGETALDWAVQHNNTSAALYLSWLGAECKEENKKYEEVRLQTWIEAGCQQEAQFWAVAANDVDTLKLLGTMNNVTLDRPKLRSLAKLFNNKEVWSYVTSLQSLAWQRLRQSVPAVYELTPQQLLEKKVPGHVVRILQLCREPEVADDDKLEEKESEFNSESDSEEEDWRSSSSNSEDASEDEEEDEE